MVYRKAAATLALALAMTAGADAATCKGDRYLFVGEQSALEPDLQMRAYFPEGQTPGEPVRFEGWYGKEMAWRVTGEYECSNGIVICRVVVPLTNGETVEGVETSIIEKGAPAYLVFSQLGASAYRAQTRGESPPKIKAEWNGEEPETSPDEPAIVLPEVWKVSGCRK